MLPMYIDILSTISPYLQFSFPPTPITWAVTAQSIADKNTESCFTFSVIKILPFFQILVFPDTCVVLLISLSTFIKSMLSPFFYLYQIVF